MVNGLVQPPNPEARYHGKPIRSNVPWWMWCGRPMSLMVMNLTFSLKKEPEPSAVYSAVACYETRQILSLKCGSQCQNPCNRLRLPG